jgi:polysaccharide biosynthesis/export protein
MNFEFAKSRRNATLLSSVVLSIMISRTSFIGMVLAAWLGVNCVPAFCAGAEDQGGSGRARTAADSARMLSPNDVISVTVFQEDDLAAKNVIIDKNGMVMLPLLKQVEISGMTVADAQAKIQQLYDKDYLVNPQVNLVVEQFAKRHFAVLGNVNKAGSIEFPQNESVNLLEAIAMAGGYTRLGAPSKVDVKRIENGAIKIYRLDAGEMSKNPTKKSFEILPDDIINVGERTF